MGAKRTIRTYARRSGRMTPGQRRALRELWPAFGVEFSRQPLDLDALFGREADKVFEIGFGNGDTLIEQARANPDADFLGVEVHEPGVGHCLLGAAAAGLGNLRVIVHDAIEVLEQQIPDASLHRVNLYFPDPWPKKRHHKRRILQPAFLSLVARKLKPGGTFNIATDWADYAEHIDAVLASARCFELADRRRHAGDRAPGRPTTRFERRGLREGHHIWDWRLKRI